jgi:3-hydroxyacyl-CoA dehydrogenase
MTKKIKKVGVIGAGTMGAGIAGQVANAGIEVILLDLPSDNDDVNALARRGLERLKNPEMPGLISEEAEALIYIGNTQDDFDKLADCDWVAEAIIERLEIKQQLYRSLIDCCDADTIITSNTSTIPIAFLTEGMPDSFCQHFAITHFFNPVRFMRLLELVRGDQTTDEVINTLSQFSEKQLGKGVILCEDKPGFLANRVGVFAIQCALNIAFEIGLSPVEADAVFGRPFGFPKTGVFGLYDLIGIDLMVDVAQSLVNILPNNDPFHKYAKTNEFITSMVANGQTGNKNNQGFYQGTGGDRKAIDFNSGEYVSFARIKSDLLEKSEKEGVKVLLQDRGPYGEFAWKVLSEVLCYATSLLPDVTSNPADIDDAMKLGYNWIKGPFELLDNIGHEYFIKRLTEEGRLVPAFLLKNLENNFYNASVEGLQVLQETGIYAPITRSNDVLRLSELKQTLKAENSNAVASWYEYKESAVVEFHSKANALDSGSLDILSDAVYEAEKRGLRGVVVHNDSQHFSCGVSLWSVRECFEMNDYQKLDDFLKHFQNTMLQMRDSNLPVVSAPVGMSIGGGFEVVLHTDQVIANTNSVMGLVESSVGLIPAGGGCKEVLYRWNEKLGDSRQAAWNAFMNIGLGKLANSPLEAEKLAFSRPTDSVHVNRDHMLGIALSSLSEVTKIPQREPLRLTGKTHFEEMKLWLSKNLEKGLLTPHDQTVGIEVARIVTGGNCNEGVLVTEQDLFNAERASFISLAKTPETQARIISMLDAGQTLRN